MGPFSPVLSWDGGVVGGDWNDLMYVEFTSDALTSPVLAPVGPDRDRLVALARQSLRNRNCGRGTPVLRSPMRFAELNEQLCSTLSGTLTTHRMTSCTCWSSRACVVGCR
jgi:hypothetical protein